MILALPLKNIINYKFCLFTRKCCFLSEFFFAFSVDGFLNCLKQLGISFNLYIIIIIIFYQSLGMSQTQIHTKIIQYLGHNSAVQHFQRINNHQERLLRHINQLPHLTPQQIRNICKVQEQNIIQKVLPLRPFDLYSQISEVCPDEKDLKHISAEQVTSRLNLYNSKLILTQRPTYESQSESQQQWSQSKSQVFFGEVNFNICLMQEQQQEDMGEHTMRNIFEECDNQNCWNTNEYFGLS